MVIDYCIYCAAPAINGFLCTDTGSILLAWFRFVMERLCSNSVVFDSFLHSALEALLVEATVSVVKTLACSLLVMNYFPIEAVFPKENGAFGSFSIARLHAVKRPDPQNEDGSETEDDEDEDEDEEEADDQDDDAGEEDAGSGKDGEDEGDPEDEPEANGEAGSGDEDEEEEDDDEDDEDDDGEEEEEDEDEDEEDEELPQPPAKKRK